MQVAARANLLSAFIPADAASATTARASKDLHGLFVNERIADRPGMHVLDAIGSFCEPLGLRQTRSRLGPPGSRRSTRLGRAQWPDDGMPTLVDLARVPATYCATGVPSAMPPSPTMPPRAAGASSCAAGAASWSAIPPTPSSRRCPQPALDLVGKDTLKQLPALLERADLVMTPDSGPMHIANAMGTKVLGLHAASNPARSGPYSDRRYCVDRYDDAARTFLGKPASELDGEPRSSVPASWT